MKKIKQNVEILTERFSPWQKLRFLSFTFEIHVRCCNKSQFLSFVTSSV